MAPGAPNSQLSGTPLDFEPLFFLGSERRLDLEQLRESPMKYPFSSLCAPDRSHSGVLEEMVQAGRLKEPIHGVKGPSILIKIQGLDLVWGLPT
ncbi:hypothetical protein MRX96_038433 [Rhipicephalus microplus]